MTEIRLDVELAHPPERVWRALVEPARLAEWFLPNDLRPVAGLPSVRPDRDTYGRRFVKETRCAGAGPRWW